MGSMDRVGIISFMVLSVLTLLALECDIIGNLFNSCAFFCAFVRACFLISTHTELRFHIYQQLWPVSPNHVVKQNCYMLSTVFI